MNNYSFCRLERLVGADAYERLRAARVLVVGVGGVGSWCVEGLVRSGIGNITIVDSDCVDQSNINRQLPALVSTVGRPKVEVLKDRMLQINPELKITAMQMHYDADTASEIALDAFDYVIDAIDSVSDKALLIHNATSARGVTLYSSMGAALKMDPSRIAESEFWKVKGCPLARALRQKFKRFPALAPRRKFRCVYSDELLTNKDVRALPDADFNGTIAHITAIFGFRLSSMVVSDISAGHK